MPVCAGQACTESACRLASRAATVFRAAVHCGMPLLPDICCCCEQTMSANVRNYSISDGKSEDIWGQTCEQSGRRGRRQLHFKQIKASAIAEMVY